MDGRRRVPHVLPRKCAVYSTIRNKEFKGPSLTGGFLDLGNFEKRLAELEKPIHLREAAERLKLSVPTLSKYVHVLAAAGKIRLKRAGSTILILEVKHEQKEQNPSMA